MALPSSLPVYIFFPPPLQTKGWEHRFAQTYCQQWRREALERLGYSVVRLEDREALFELPGEASVLWLEDPLLVIASSSLNKMCQGLASGYVGVAPTLIPTEYPFQQAAPAFTPVNRASFEALNPAEQPVHWREVERLDPAGGLFRASWLQATSQRKSWKGPLAVLESDVAVSFRASTDHAREDLVSMIPQDAGEVLDVGCASGKMGYHWLSRYPNGRIDGLEPEPIQAAQARQWYRQVWEDPIAGFEPINRYDVIVCGDVIEHLDDPWLQLQRMVDWLRPGGYLLLSVPNAGHWSLVADQAQGRFEYLPWGLTCITHRRWFTEHSLRQVLIDIGLIPRKWSREQPVPSPQGEAFIQMLVQTDMGDEVSLRTLQMRVLAQKPM